MDIYYDEKQMNKWRDSCVKGQESYKLKVERFEKEIQSLRSQILEKRSYEGSSTDDTLVKELFRKIENNVAEKEPLIISLISTAFEDLKLIHKNLNVFCA